MKKHIYADNAATTKLDVQAFEAMKPWLLEEYGNASQIYSFARGPKRALADARETIAECINAQPEEIFFTSGGTEGDNWVVKESALSDPDHRATITSAIEHHAILRSCYSIEKQKYPVVYLKPTKAGLVTSEALESSITDQTRLVSVMFANNEIGTIQPIENLCAIAHQHGALFHTDAVQAVGHIEIDVKRLGLDYLSASAHKFNGPKGVGFLYIKKSTLLPPLIDGGSQESGRRAGTENIALAVGMATALKINCEALSKNREHILSLEKRLLGALASSNVPFRRNGGGNTLPGLISLSFPNADGEAILHRLDLMGISISTGSACNSISTDVSHVLKAIQLEEKCAMGTIRISLGKSNTNEEIDSIVAALISVLQKH